MAFSDETKDAAYRRANGKCECRRSGCGHPIPHGKVLARAEARFHHSTAAASGGTDDLSNCEVLDQACHVATGTYGD
jgi:hypothetical protein